MEFLVHTAVFCDLVLSFLSTKKIVRINILKTDEHSPYAGERTFLHEMWQLVAERVDLNDLAQVNEAIKIGPNPFETSLIRWRCWKPQ
jgi:hypothetical protein